MHPTDSEILDIARRCLHGNAYLFDEPAAYHAGVEDALMLVEMIANHPSVRGLQVVEDAERIIRRIA